MVMPKIRAELVVRNSASAASRPSVLCVLLRCSISILHFRMLLPLRSPVSLHFRMFLPLRRSLLMRLFLAALLILFLHLVILLGFRILWTRWLRFFLFGLRLGFFLLRRFVFLFFILRVHQRRATYQHR